MAVRHILTGGTYSKGTGKESGKEYEICTLFAGKALKPWQTERGAQISFGIESVKLPFVPSPALLAKFETTMCPALVEFQYEPDPEDPRRNLVCDFKVIRSLFDNPVTQSEKK
ncbi:RstB-like putative ssDNA binding protein [Vibrio phage VAI1]|uniref:RstB-like putative ssDNA binding protein n=1 Tax=Vibrio phage VAI1 TaxID=2601671 RepID=A0A7D0NN12_9VIRU|nr:RstB-like putative ssDNA binding protein [Vibrio phage VAI1]QFG06240.1 RstB-like putative ssDNA binding protein [Vibrio phage VAI1]